MIVVQKGVQQLNLRRTSLIHSYLLAKVMVYYFLKGYCQGLYHVLNKKLKVFSRTLKDTFPIFQGLHSMQKRALTLCLFLVLPQHE